MPINRKYNLSLLLDTLREELRLKHNYKVLFEYVMLAGVNDRLDNTFPFAFLLDKLIWIISIWVICNVQCCSLGWNEIM